MFTHQINDKLSFKLPTIADATDLLALIDTDRGPQMAAVGQGQFFDQ